MTEGFIYNYFEALAAGHPAILHTEQKPAFYRVMETYNLDEFDAAVRSMKAKTAVLLEIDDSTSGETDATFEQQPIRLHFLKKPESQKFDVVRDVRDEMKALAIDFIGCMRQDGLSRHERTDLQDGTLKTAGIRFDSRVRWGNMNKIDQLWYGKTITFDWKAPIDLSYKPANWS